MTAACVREDWRVGLLEVDKLAWRLSSASSRACSSSLSLAWSLAARLWRPDAGDGEGAATDAAIRARFAGVAAGFGVSRVAFSGARFLFKALARGALSGSRWIHSRSFSGVNIV